MKGVEVPPGATVDIHIHITAPVTITPFIARQKVAAFVLSEISTQLLAETPVLNVGERLCWSVPVVLTSPARGVYGWLTHFACGQEAPGPQGPVRWGSPSG